MGIIVRRLRHGLWLLTCTHLLGAAAMSNPTLTKVSPEGAGVVEAQASSTHHLPPPQQKTAASGQDGDKGFMEDIGFNHFFTDIGLQGSASNLGIGASSGQEGFTLPQEFSAGAGEANSKFGPQFGGSHSNLGFGLGSAASTQKQQNSNAKIDPAVQGFIPTNPLSFGGYTPSSSSFVDTKAKPFVSFHPSASPKTYKSPSHNPYASASKVQASDAKLRSPSYNNQNHGQKPKVQYTKYAESPATSHSYSNLFSPQPSSLEKPAVSPYQNKSPKDANTKKSSNYNNKPRDNSYQSKPRPSSDYGDSYQESHLSPDYIEDVYAHVSGYDDDDDEYSYAPTHQESRPHSHRTYPSHHNQGTEYVEHSSKPSHKPSAHRPTHRDRSSGYSHGDQHRYDDQPRHNSKYDDQPRHNSKYDDHQSYNEGGRSESRPHEQYDEQDSGKSTSEPCDVVEKDGMTCKICKDNDGGYSEHCAQSSRRGKDRVYANSRGGSHNQKGPDVGRKPYRSQTKSSPVYTPRSRQNNKQQSNGYQDHSYKPYDDDDYFGQYSTVNSKSTPYAQDRVGEFGIDVLYDPYTEGSSYDPFVASEARYDGFDESALDFGHEDHGHRSSPVGKDDYTSQGHSHGNAYGHQQASPNAKSKDGHKELDKSESKNKKQGQERYTSPVIPPHFKPLDHEDNYTELSKMVTQFQKKDRASCKEVQRNGMICFVCTDPHGSEDEECVYARKDPNGHDIKYSEEVSYGSKK